MTATDNVLTRVPDDVLCDVAQRLTGDHVDMRSLALASRRFARLVSLEEARAAQMARVDHVRCIVVDRIVAACDRFARIVIATTRVDTVVDTHTHDHWGVTVTSYTGDGGSLWLDVLTPSPTCRDAIVRWACAIQPPLEMDATCDHRVTFKIRIERTIYGELTRIISKCTAAIVCDQRRLQTPRVYTMWSTKADTMYVAKCARDCRR